MERGLGLGAANRNKAVPAKTAMLGESASHRDSPFGADRVRQHENHDARNLDLGAAGCGGHIRASKITPETALNGRSSSTKCFTARFALWIPRLGEIRNLIPRDGQLKRRRLEKRRPDRPKPSTPARVRWSIRLRCSTPRRAVRADIGRFRIRGSGGALCPRRLRSRARGNLGRRRLLARERTKRRDRPRATSDTARKTPAPPRPTAPRP